MNKTVSEQVTKGERYSYAGYFFGQNIFYTLISQFLMLYYTDALGITTVAVGTLFFIARIWDAINDPIMGVLVDKAKLKGGKFKPWVNIGIFSMPISTALIFIQIDGSLSVKIFYAYITYILWDMLYTMSDVPIYALSTVMTKDVHERVKIISTGRVLAFLGTLIASVATIPVVQRMGWTRGVILLCFIGMLTMLPVKYKTHERVKDYSVSSPSIISLFQFLFSNKYLLIFNAALIICSVTNTLMPSLNYFVKYNLGKESLIPIVTLAAMLPSLLVPIFLPALVKRFGKKSILLTSVVLFIIASILSFYVGYENFVLVLILTGIRGIGYSVPIILTGMFTVDCVEYGAYKSGHRLEGITFSAQTFTAKLTSAISGATSSFLLAYYGYKANEMQSEKALNGIFKMFTLFPVAGYILMFIIIFFFYQLKESDVEKMMSKTVK
ncbi:MFS transporter [Anaerocolumna sedimenticola]|uniref:MFS transporter n=1 Tax=Anaerocolumna sedimenticola TaxID=2696063 RepID=A0A6P1TIK1_9FIRM|nr:glycoside-pentoside-hexuronide (GPH):cation symporter [Anaerocolumna sedimenticola]QHQ59746.1 MFS transporter [Anaerocolumna sedimenticola]